MVHPIDEILKTIDYSKESHFEKRTYSDVFILTQRKRKYSGEFFDRQKLLKNYSERVFFLQFERIIVQLIHEPFFKQRYSDIIISPEGILLIREMNLQGEITSDAEEGDHGLRTVR